METIWIPLPMRDVEICSAPVEVEEFRAYETALQSPQQNRHSSPHQPIIGISASEASRYSEWAGQQSGHIYRLPTLTEMRMLAEMTDLANPEQMEYGNEH